MNIFQQRQFDRFKRATQFIDAHSEDFAPTSQAIVLNAELKNTLASVQESSKETPQETQKPKNSASAKKDALNALREELNRIAQTAEALKTIDPDFNNTFELPDKRLKDKLVGAAQQFQQDAGPLKERFLSFEMKEDFLETLTAKLEAYQATQTPKTTGSKGNKNKSADSSIPFTKAAQLMDVLNIVVRNKYEDNSATLTEWEKVTSLNTPPRRRKGQESAPESAPEAKQPEVKRGRKPRTPKS